MYRVSILKRKSSGSQVVKGSLTRTTSFKKAKNAFLALRKENEFSGENYILMMTESAPNRHPKKLAIHLYFARPGEEGYFNEDQTIITED